MPNMVVEVKGAAIKIIATRAVPNASKWGQSTLACIQLCPQPTKRWSTLPRPHSWGEKPPNISDRQIEMGDTIKYFAREF